MSTDFLKIEDAAVSGFLHRPSNPAGDGLVLTHGAGANCTSPLLIAIAEAFSRTGFFVLRYDLAFRRRRRFGPPHPSAAPEDRASVRAAIDCMRSFARGPIVAAGHSYGGRQTSILAAEDARLCDAILLLSYSLHPPNKPAQLRTDHLPRLRTPALFVHGTNDPFGSIDEMGSAIALIPAHAQLMPVDGAGHDLSRGRFDLAALVLEPLRALYSG